MVTLILAAYLWGWGVWLINDCANPRGREKIGVAIWPLLPLFWIPQIVWQQGRRAWKLWWARRRSS